MNSNLLPPGSSVRFLLCVRRSGCGRGVLGGRPPAKRRSPGPSSTSKHIPCFPVNILTGGYPSF
ncbi:hypothetical protein HMPREF0262_02164 [Clostridium sp. ATCC 29733]|nr:hypothetical protein HMPREF0262_02164 [Clostridium sp. ATCC 29733]